MPAGTAGEEEQDTASTLRGSGSACAHGQHQLRERHELPAAFRRRPRSAPVCAGDQFRCIYRPSKDTLFPLLMVSTKRVVQPGPGTGIQQDSAGTPSRRPHPHHTDESLLSRAFRGHAHQTETRQDALDNHPAIMPHQRERPRGVRRTTWL